jgi:cytochrome P450
MEHELDPFSYAFHEDPYPVYHRLRDHHPVYENPRLGFYALSRFADVVAASLDHGTYSSARGTLVHEIDPAMLAAMPMMIFMDPPQQTRLRKLVSRAFTPRAVAALEPAIRALAVRLVEELRARGGGDFVGELAAVLPVEVISTLLGVPAADRAQVREWTDRSLERDPDTPELPPATVAALVKLNAYFGELVAERRRRPGHDDLVSGLLEAEVEREDGERERLSEREIVGFVGLLSGAGNETVTKLLGNAIVLLARHPDAREALVREPDRLPGAIEECLRYWPPSQYQGRSLTRDVTLHGVTMAKGARVLLLTGAACRDEREFPNADRFEIGREIAIQLALGHGIHKCLGAALARLEARVALEEWLARIPRFEIDEAGLERVHMTSVMGFARVPFRVV